MFFRVRPLGRFSLFGMTTEDNEVSSYKALAVMPHHCSVAK